MAEPVRFQRSRQKGWLMPPNTVYVGRPSKWGNPWSPKNCTVLHSDGKGGIAGSRPATLPECVDSFREYLAEPQMKGFVEEIKAELRGKNLSCWCPLDQPCHADVLLEIANAEDAHPLTHALDPEGEI